MTRPKIARYVACILAAAALWQFGEALYIEAKAELAQHLIARAWARAESGVAMPKPWPWADTTPVARLTVHGRRLYVLADATGRTLAFGPGHLSGTALPGHGGNTVISGHRDTHFAFLEHVRPGDKIVIELPDRSVHRYRVNDSAVVHPRDMGVIAERDHELVTLLTCFPFRTLTPRAPLRYVVTASRV
jgi:sortase A